VSPPLLAVEGLTTDLRTSTGVLRAVDGVSFELERGEALALVGESGSGKTLTCLSIVRLLPAVGSIVGGSVRLEGEELTTKSDREFRSIRGGRIAMILQDPLGSLDPVYTVGDQLAETLRLDRPRPSRLEVRARSLDALKRVQIAEPKQRLRSYPFELSGGMQQRVAAAIALARNPALLIADEPTTALDVKTQKRFLDLLSNLRREQGMGLLLVTHDLGIVRDVCDRVAIMYAGRIVETGGVEDVFARPRHPYTRALIAALPRLSGERVRRLAQIDGEPPDLLAPPPGCRFAPRCPFATALCVREYPPTVAADGATVSCWVHVPDAPAGAPREAAAPAR
jgi:oligopeptide/dipeptide ABC transporter ATP-binding protein